jgi:hypothetical protein
VLFDFEEGFFAGLFGWEGGKTRWLMMC